MTDNKIVAVAVELDALLDTRITTIAAIDPKAVKGVIDNGYLDRWIDDFDQVDMEAYRNNYKNRSVETLESPIMTGAVRLLRELIGRLVADTYVHPAISDVKLIITTHPYQLNAAELETFQSVMSKLFNGMCAIELCDTPLLGLSPQYCKENNVAVLMLYNCHEWLITHRDNLSACPIPTVELCGPALLTVKPTPEEIAEFVAERQDPVDVITRAYASVIALRLYPARFFSFVSAPNYDTTTTPTDSATVAESEEVDLVHYVPDASGSD